MFGLASDGEELERDGCSCRPKVLLLMTSAAFEGSVETAEDPDNDEMNAGLRLVDDEANGRFRQFKILWPGEGEDVEEEEREARLDDDNRDRKCIFVGINGVDKLD